MKEEKDMAGKNVVDVIDGWWKNHPVAFNELFEEAYYEVKVDDDGRIVCPVCGKSNGLHVRAHDAAYANGKVDAVKVEMRCEYGCDWTLTIGGDDGNMFIGGYGWEAQR